MTDLRMRALREYLFLEDHPFDPARDPRQDFDFRARRAPLTQELDVFRVQELWDHFLQVGPFAVGVRQVNDYLQTKPTPLDATSVPIVLICGESGAGRSSMSRVVAYLVRRQCARAPSLKTVKVMGEHFGKIQYAIADHLQEHATAHAVPELLNLLKPVERLKPEDPDEMFLSQMYEKDDLRQGMQSTPLLIEVIEPITYARRDWITMLDKMLRPLNIALIFLTDDEVVYKLFDMQVKRGVVDGIPVRLTDLKINDALDLLQKRVDWFRRSPMPAGLPAVFPFDTDNLRKAYEDRGSWRIKPLLELFRSALNRKLQELAKQCQGIGVTDQLPAIDQQKLVVSWNDVAEGYRVTLQTSVAGGKL